VLVRQDTRRSSSVVEKSVSGIWTLERGMKELLNSKEAAQLLGISVYTLKGWRLAQKGPPYIKGSGKSGHPRYRRAALILHLENATINPGK
jgi:hypothetical protein